MQHLKGTNSYNAYPIITGVIQQVKLAELQVQCIWFGLKVKNSVVTTIKLSPSPRWLATIEPPPPPRCCTVFSVVFSALFLENYHHYPQSSYIVSTRRVRDADHPPRVPFRTCKQHDGFHILCCITDRLCLQLPEQPRRSRRCIKWDRSDGLI